MYTPAMGRASLSEGAGREVSLGWRRGPLATLPFTGPAVAPKRRTLRMDLRSGPRVGAAMTYTLELFQRLINGWRWYCLAGMAILVAAWGGYVGWQHRAAANP